MRSNWEKLLLTFKWGLIVIPVVIGIGFVIGLIVAFFYEPPLAAILGGPLWGLLADGCTTIVVAGWFLFLHMLGQVSDAVRNGSK